MMRYPDVVDVEILHAEVIDRIGGSHGIRDRGALESAVAQPQMAFGGDDLYASVEEKVTALCFSLVKNHPFIDGNKRVGHAAAEFFLLINGSKLQGVEEEHERIILELAAGELSREELLECVKDWIETR
jgi:death on curing protein